MLPRMGIGPREANDGYFAAVAARVHGGTQGPLHAAQRVQVSPTSLAKADTARRLSWGLATDCHATWFNVPGMSARPLGTERNREGSTAPQTMRLVDEGGIQRIASRPGPARGVLDVGPRARRSG